VNIKCIVTERPNSLSTASYAEYRLLSKRYVDCVPFYVYDNRYAISTLDIDQTPKIVLVISRSIAESFKRQFHSLWDQATPLAPIKIK